MTNQKINIERLKSNLLEAGSVANSGKKGYTRTAYSKEETAALNWLKTKLSDLSVTVSQDKLGNVFGRWGDRNQPAVSFGSHLDTVPEGGLYDGALGVIAGLECLETLIENNEDSGVPLELICFVGEEANPLGGTFGSRAMTGLINHSQEYESKLKQFGYTWDYVTAAKREKQDFHCFLEMHIEQGSLLETNHKQIGIVTAIAGILRLFVRIHGRAGHSGTIPMSLRKDALLSASKLVQKVNELAVEANSDIVATVGEMEIFPNAANVIPGEAKLTVEIRGSDWEEMTGIANAVRDWAGDNIDAEISTAVEKQPNELSKTVQSCIDEACQKEKVSHQYMVSGANHDAMSMSRITNAGMIFVPSKDGISHHPDEFTSWEDIETGANVMLQTIRELIEQYGKKA